MYPIFWASFPSLGECVCEARMDWLSLGAPLSPLVQTDSLGFCRLLLSCFSALGILKEEKNILLV